MILIKVKEGYSSSLLSLLRVLKSCLFKDYQVFLDNLFRPPSKISKGRRKINHDLIFKQALEQYENGKVEHLNTVVINPIFLKI